MGGKSSGVTENTRRIYVESASFDPITVRKTSQRLGIRTDSSLRFEKGVDFMLPHLASVRYWELLLHFVPDAKQGKTSVITNERRPTNIAITHEMILRKIGKDISEKDITDILSRLGFLIVLKK